MKVSMDHQQLLGFTGWKPAYIHKKGKAEIVSKLESMGMGNVTVSGRGRNTVYTFDIPESFWITLPFKHMKHSEVMVDIMDILLNENVVDGLVMFHSEFYEDLAVKHNTTAKAVENTFSRIKAYLNDMDMLNKPNYCKSHRVIMGGGHTWLTGDKAVIMDAKIKRYWRFFHEIYKGRDKELLRKFSKQFYYMDIPRIVGASYYRIVKRVKLDPRFHKDVAAARQSFLNTFNMVQVRQELYDKHEAYREAAKQRKEEEKAAYDEWLETYFAS